MITESKILQGDWIENLKNLESESVQTCITSPPYFGLRDYGAEGQFGLELTVKEYISKSVEGFNEVRRVLRKDGTLWLNLGDSYAGSGKGGQSEGKRSENWQPSYSNNGKKYGFKSKDLMMIPARVAIALQESGWYLRAEIVWHKPNPMPEGVTDRPTKSHEMIYLFSRSEKYFYDHVAIQEPANYDGRKTTMFAGSAKYQNSFAPTELNAFYKVGHERWQENEDGEKIRNKRSVWTVTTKPYAEAHFATFPEKLIEPCVLAGTSEKGCCADCGAPYKRIVQTNNPSKEANIGIDMSNGAAKTGNPQTSKGLHRNGSGVYSTAISLGWQKSCSCSTSEIIPCTVIDPFNGAGTTGVVALKNNRSYVGIELNPDYIKLTENRMKEIQRKLF